MTEKLKKRIPKTIRFNIEEKEDFEIIKESEEFMDQLFTEVVDSIEYAIENNIDKVSIFKIADYNFTISVEKNNYSKILDKVIDFYASHEDYDICQLVKTLKLKL